MKLGMLSSELRRPTIGAFFQAVRGLGLEAVQLDLASVRSGQLPGQPEAAVLETIRDEARRHGVAIAALNGTYNMIHPDPAIREQGLAFLASTASACQALGCGLVTLCTGTRNRESMWRWHDDNLLPEAWEDLIGSMARAIAIADKFDVQLGIETEASNVVNTPERARRLLDEMRSPRLCIIMDAANLFQRGQARPENVHRILDHAFTLLGGEIGLAHGKDIKAGDGLEFTHAGNGIIDFDHFVEKLQEAGYQGPLLVHGIKHEEDFPAVVSFMRGVLARHPAGGSD